MTGKVELIFDFVSPNGYLSWYPLRDILARTGTERIVTPVFLGGMHRLTGNAPPMVRDKDVKGKIEYAMLEMRRFIEKYGLDRYKLHPQFPFNSVTLQRMLVAVDGEERVRLVETLLPALWEDGVAIDEPGPLAERLSGAGFDAADLMAKAQDPAIKQQLVDNTQSAIDRGAFGIPTFFVDIGAGEEMFFGKERLSQIEEMLASV